ncbi:hypothetical protein HispidOSU_013614, partial [Sigmodon hispidus]
AKSHFTLTVTVVCSPHLRRTSNLLRDGSGAAIGYVCEQRVRELVMSKDFEERSREGCMLLTSASAMLKK